VESGDNVRAAALLRKARAILPSDPTLEKLWQQSTGDVSMASEPPAAEFSIRPYGAALAAREIVGRTPLEKVRIPNAAFIFRVEKPGFAPVEWLEGPPAEDRIVLVPKESLPAGMAPISDCATGLGSPLSDEPGLKLADYFVDRHEVTNAEYKKFVDAGGYGKPEYWKQPFERDGKTLSFEEALPAFRDGTGRPGPASWEAGTFASGLDNYPVAGVSWYEASAYAAFAGKSLPTVYHWTCAAEPAGASLVVPGSNFRSAGTRPVGDPRASSGWGTTDMAGNVKEWCSNESKDGKRYILGGGFGEPDYMFVNVDARSPWDRAPNFGFRCVKLKGPPAEETARKIEPPFRDYLKEKPATDEVFRAYRSLFSYDKAELAPKVEERKEAPDWIREKVSFNAAYGGERVIAYVFTPKNARPPHQAVVYFPGGGALQIPKLDPEELEGAYDFLVRSGRTFVLPLYKGHFERQAGLKPGGKPLGKWRDQAIMQVKDLERTIDYLESRSDVDASRLAYLGFSMGGAISPLMLANEQRFKAAILTSGGFWFRTPLPEVDWLNFVGHVTVPVLMLNGRFDDYFPYETSQLPMFRLLGTPAKDKKQILYPAGHGDLPRKDEVRETLDWLDKYLGPVKR
jgi:eukaryotic-like serine/threonine-protein kinase